MKKIIPYLLLFGLLYGAWYYWQSQPKPPLVAYLLPYEKAQISRISIHPNEGQHFELFANNDNWIVEGNNRSMSCSTSKVEHMLEVLLNIKSSGLVQAHQLGKEILRLQLSGDEISEQLRIFAPPDSFPRLSWLIQLNEVEDIFLVEQMDLLKLPIQFEDYRNHLLLSLESHSQIDSLVWWQAQDSSRIKLLVRDGQDSLTLDSLHHEWQTINSNQFADFFGEIRHANKLMGRYLFYGTPDTTVTQLDVYADDGWEQPFVYKGNGQEYFALDSLLIAIE